MNSPSNNSIEICLLGDVFRHIIVKPRPESSKSENEKKEPYKSYIAYAGVPLLRRMIIEAIKDEFLERKTISKQEKEAIEDIKPDYQKIIDMGYDINTVIYKACLKIKTDIIDTLNLYSKYINDKKRSKSPSQLNVLDNNILKYRNKLIDFFTPDKSILDEVCGIQLTESMNNELLEIFENLAKDEKFKSEAYQALNILPNRNLSDKINIYCNRSELETQKQVLEKLINLFHKFYEQQVYPDIKEQKTDNPILGEFIYTRLYYNKISGNMYQMTYKEPTNRLLIMLDYFPQSLSPGKNVLRQKPKEEYSTSSTYWPLPKSINTTLDSGDKINKMDKHNLEIQFTLANGKTPKILVIYDRNLSFCKYVRTNEEIKKDGTVIGKPQTILNNLINKDTKGVVIGIREKLELRDNQQIEYNQEPTYNPDEQWLIILKNTIKNSNNEVQKRCVVIITADALRESGMDITVNGSLEQAVHQVVGCLDKNPSKYPPAKPGALGCEPLEAALRGR